MRTLGIITFIVFVGIIILGIYLVSTGQYLEFLLPAKTRIQINNSKDSIVRLQAEGELIPGT